VWNQQPGSRKNCWFDRKNRIEIDFGPTLICGIMSTATTDMPQAAPAPTSINDEERLWEAIVARKQELDGAIFYGVVTTGIYCRTVCPARRPKRENVRFFGSPEAAERAGLRACLRCHPKGKQVADAAMSLVRRVVDFIEQNLEGTITLEVIASALEQSQFHLQRTFTAKFGISPIEYANARRMAVFRTAVRMGENVAEATYTAGFGSSRALYEKAGSHLGMTPAKYRKRAAGLSISYSTVKTSLGHLLVAQTNKGVCKISLGDDPKALVEDLQFEFGKAQFAEHANPSSLQPLLDLIDAKTKKIDLPLDLRGTAFQMRVWKELQKIPYGSTATYEQIARRIGSPAASRAVARACASNKVALAIPCHRVVRKGGELSGYRWGVQRKKALLEKEAALARN
jgi:AraC family transcriptional regulator of adaptative response/methylated-DNA-[protein]-cysteine methyltransferase